MVRHKGSKGSWQKTYLVTSSLEVSFWQHSFEHIISLWEGEGEPLHPFVNCCHVQSVMVYVSCAVLHSVGLGVPDTDGNKNWFLNS